ncbi:MAG: DUF5682 family protein [Defluviitaleaceae bacterium]|nr:DUF5682 family protein [Defluviitaleaceae bacterium]
MGKVDKGRILVQDELPQYKDNANANLRAAGCRPYENQLQPHADNNTNYQLNEPEAGHRRGGNLPPAQDIHFDNSPSDNEHLNKLITDIFNINHHTAFFPIRHHSPACAYHIKHAIEIYKPDCILIEGPSDTDPLLSHMRDSEPPIAIYYSYQDKEGSHACYYPMQSFSPEYEAIQTALAEDIPVHFIDLPLGNLILDQRKQAQDTNQNVIENKSWYNDYYLQRSKYIEALCEKENCRGHNELWEKLFEMPARTLSTQQFIQNMLAFCYYSRANYPHQLELEEQNIIREMYMAENIQKHQKKYRRILAITGGFHTAALMELIEGGKIKKTKPATGQAYLIPYSYEECDQLTGYASGMPHPSYYQDLYARLLKGEDDFFHKTTLNYIAKLAKTLRKNRESVSLSEEAAAFAMGLGLASLREKPQPGVYEFLDGVQSAFIKGELNLATSFIMTEAVKQLRGEKIGAIAPSAPVPPIVVDFIATAKDYKMNTATTALKTITLDIVSKPRHRQQSAFLHRLAFLGNTYARKTYGPDYENRTGTKLVREKWDYTFTAHVTSALIEKSHMGGTIVDVCESILSERIRNDIHSSAQAADLLLKAGLMALLTSDRLIGLVRENISQDNSFISLAECIRSLTFLHGIEHILRLNQGEIINQAKEEALTRIIPMIPTLTAADEKEDFLLAQHIKMLYQAAEINIKEACNDTMADFTQGANIPPTLDGAVTGLLYDAGIFSLEDVQHRANAYLRATGDMLALAGRFLRGIFLTAKDIIFYNSGFVEGLNSAISTISYEEFVEILPDLRLAFTFFTPREIDRIGKTVLAVLGLADSENITSLPQIDENQLKTMTEIDLAARDLIKANFPVLGI